MSKAAPTPDACDDSRCERCGAEASVFVSECVCSDPAEGAASCESTSHAYCKACAKAVGEYPGFFARALGLVSFLLILPLLPILRRKYPPEYWRKKVAEIEARKKRRSSETGSP